MNTPPKARPILFSAPMVRALLDGRKTQTRRIIKPQPNNLDMGACDVFDAKGYHPAGSGKLGFHFTYENGQRTIAACPYGSRGDLHWVREAFARNWNQLSDVQQDRSLVYRADAGPRAQDDGTDLPWRPSIHMPRWASRLTLEITDMRVQRLQDISEQDAIAEGIETTDFYREEHPPSICYSVLWDTINGAGSWTANPWVWALTFTVHKQNVDDYLATRVPT